MKYQVKLVLSIVGVLIFTASAIVSVCIPETSVNEKIFLGVFCGAAAFIDAFVFMIPFIFSYQAIKYSNINPNRYSYNRKTFVDRKIIYKTIKNQIKSLDKSNENTIWIKLCGTDGIGKKSLVSKFFNSFHYPNNKFFFINQSASFNNLFESLKEKYPLDNESDELLYFNKLKSLKRTFIVIPFDNAKMNTSLVAFMTSWMREIKHKYKLIIISLDNKQSAKSISSTNTYLFEYEIKPLMVADSKKLIKNMVKNLNEDEVDKIAKISEGVPENIKYICEKYVRFPEGIQVTERTDLELRMRKEVKSEFFKLCILSIVNNVISKSFIKDREILNELCITKKIYLENNNIYVSEWLLNSLLISNKYEDKFISAMDSLTKLRILNSEKYLLAKAVVLKEPDDILLILENLDKQQDYKLIKYIYLKTYFSLDIGTNTTKKKIAIIFIKALLQLGEYDLVSEAFSKIDTQLLNINNKEDYEINYLFADYCHLTSDYKKSNAIFETLISFVEKSEDILNLRFNLAHNARHSGDILKAYAEFENLINDAKKDSNIYIRSVTAKISIDYFINGYRESLINDLIGVINNSNIRFNVYRHLVSLYRRNINKLDDAISLCLTNIKELNSLNLRIIYDYYFELAECYRMKFICGEPFNYSESLTYYNKALIFAEMNSDANLRLNSIIGKSLLEFIKTNNRKRLYKQMENIINEGEKISSLIYGSILTIMEVLNNSKDCEYLKNEQFKYYYDIFKSKDIKSLSLSVM